MSCVLSLLPICRFGRRFGLLLCFSCVLLFGVGIAFAPNIYVFIILKFLDGTSGGVIIMNLSVMGRYNLWLKTLSSYEIVQQSDYWEVGVCWGRTGALLMINTLVWLSVHIFSSGTMNSKRLMFFFPHSSHSNWMDGSFKECSLHRSRNLLFFYWTDGVVWPCIFNKQLEDPAAGALLPSCPCPGIPLLVSSLSHHSTLTSL